VADRKGDSPDRSFHKRARAHACTQAATQHACTYVSARRCCGGPADRYADRIACPGYADDQATSETGRDSAEKEELGFSAGKNTSIAGFPCSVLGASSFRDFRIKKSETRRARLPLKCLFTFTRAN